MLEPSVDHAAPPAPALVRTSLIAGLSRGMDASLAILAGLSFASQLIVSTMLPILPLFAIEAGATPVVLAAMVSVSAVAVVVGQAAAGVLSDRVGARRLLPVGLAAYGTASLLTSTATSAAPIVAFRAFSGFGSGAYIVGERLYIRQVVDRARLAFANGLIQASGAVGLIIGPVLGGVAADVAGLRTPIVVVGVCSLIVAIAALFLPAPPDPNTAASRAGDVPTPTDRRALGFLLLANLALVTGYGSFITTFTPFATDNLGWTRTEIGVAFALFGLGSVVVGPWIGATADRLGRRRVGALAAIPIVAFALALTLPVPELAVFPLAFAAGAGVAGFTASWYALLSVATGGPGGGRAFGTVAAGSSFGIIVGALTAGLLWESIDIRAGMTVTVVAMAAAGVLLAAYPATLSHATPPPDPEPS